VNRDLIVGLARRGHRVRAIAPVTGADAPRAHAFECSHPEIVVRWFQQPDYVLLGAGSPDEVTAAVREEIRQFKTAIASELDSGADAVICGRESAAVALHHITAAKSTPALVIAHGTGFEDAANRAWPADLQEHVTGAYRRCNRVVLVARHMCRWLDLLRLDHAITIANATDPKRFFPASKDRDLMGRWQIAADDIVVAHLSNLGSLKRPLDIVYSAPRALAAESRLLFVILGGERLRPEMERACAELGVRDRFRFTGAGVYQPGGHGRDAV
jgi:hypothetical protein